ncbi:LOW QUALITY PROTEIN: protein unc-45 homolog B-like [Amphiura filiformis]|uniref:LOW QUALITY PROTEIN: protein unc-45 homolog B-like n=1 Tax=Amphiura filiformis TaxID=82378 RepID=UPI003B213DB9
MHVGSPCNMEGTKISEAQKLKEEGNKHYKAENYESAVASYTQALKLCPETDANRAVYYKNRAACHLKLENYDKALQDSSAALDITPGDTKALFRKCQALESLGAHEEAFKNAAKLNQLEPNNVAVQTMLRKLGERINEKIKQNSSTNNKVEQMFKALSHQDKPDVEKQRQAAQNLVVLAREEAGAEKIFRENGVGRIQRLLETGDEEVMLSGLRVLSCLCKGHRARATAVMREFTLHTLGKYISSTKEELANAAATVLLTALKAMIGTNPKEVKNKDEALVLDLSEDFKKMLMFLLGLLTDKNVSGYGRDAVIDIIIKFVPRREGTGRALTFITNGGLNKLLIVAGQVPELKRLGHWQYRMHTSVAMDKIYEEMGSDKNRNYFKDLINKYLSEKFSANLMESNMEALTAISALLQGPYDVGQELLSKEGVMQVMVAMAASPEPLHQRIALETIIHSAKKKDKCTGVLQAGVEIMKTLYESKNDHIRVRALVGLCKIGSSGGSDYSVKLFADGSTVALSKEARRFLKSAKKDHDIKKWAAEGIAYLSLDGDVKEELVDDSQALKAVIQLAQSGDDTVLYPIISMFVNLTNSYDTEKIDPEMIKLAEYAKQHIPQTHPKDDKEYVTKRVKKLLKEGIVTALVALSRTDSHSSRELLSRVYLAIVEDEDHRGLVVQQGGAKALLPLGIDGNEVGKAKAAHALAKIAITMNPEIAFPGQRSLELVRILISLLHVERSGLENFEALMALTNLAGLNDSIRTRIIKEEGLSKIEHYMWEDHEMLRRAATECMCNIVVNEQAADLHCLENDRVKLLTIYLGEEDPATAKAAAGALAILSHREEVCTKILTPKAWLELLQSVCASEDPDMRIRGVHIIANMIDSNKEVAAAVVQTSLLEILMALAQDTKLQSMGIKERVEFALKRAAEWELIKPKKDADKEEEELDEDD